MGCTISIALSGDYGILITDLAGNAFQDIYVKPYTRFGPYVIGLVAGYLLYETRKERKTHHWVTVMLWWVASTVMGLAVIYGLRDYYKDGTKPSKAADVLYLTFSR